MNLSELKDGIYYDISDADYQNDTTRIRASQLKTIFDESDYSLLVEKSFSGSSLGKAWHYFLEHKHTNDIVNMELATGVKGYDTKKNLAYISERPDKICLNCDDSEKLQDMIKILNTRNDTEVARINGCLNYPNVKNEVTVLFTVGDIKCKCRIDQMLIEDGKYHIKDYKTTSAKSISAFERDYFQLGYWIQMYFYNMGLQLATGCGFEDVDMEIFTFQTTSPYVFHTYPIIDDSGSYAEIFNLIIALTYRVDQVVNHGILNGYIPKNGSKPNLKLSAWQMKSISERLRQFNIQLK